MKTKHKKAVSLLMLNELISEVEFLNGLLSDGLKMSPAHRQTIITRVVILKETITKATKKHEKH